MFRGRHRAFRRAAWLALLALFLQSFVPALHHPASAALSDVGNMCMAPGSQPFGPSDTDKSPPHGAPACAICQTLHILSGGFVPPEAVAAPAAIFAKISPPGPAAVILEGRSVSQARARAPPVKA